MNEIQLDKDYKLQAGTGSVWITVDNVSVCIRRRDGGVLVSLHPLGQEADGELDYCSAKFDRARDLGQKIWDDLHLNRPPQVTTPAQTQHRPTPAALNTPPPANPASKWRKRNFFKRNGK